jgi:DNA (cytosine-5)-methyltransferase 1
MSTGQAGAEIGIGTTLNCNHEAPLVTVAFDTTQITSPQNGLGVAAEVAPTLDRAQPCAVAFEPGIMGREGGHHYEEISGTLRKEPGDNQMAVATAMQVRRLTPRECERLQGFPDDYTQVPYRNKPAADGPRYKALGNSMAVPVMAWIGKRIQQVEDISA